MAKKKGQDYFLTPKEQEDFLKYADENNISNTKMAEIQGVSGGTITNWINSNKVLVALRENVQRYVENPKLKEKLGKIREISREDFNS